MSPALQSREYKLMLQTPRFAGSEDSLAAQVDAFWQDFRAAVGAAGLATTGALTKTKDRPVTFYDTTERHLSDLDVPFRDYLFRARGRSDGSAKVTLKYRHPDRLVAGDRDMRAAKKLVKKSEVKFEKDIKPVVGRMRSLYSYSSSGRTAGTFSVRTVADIMALFPGLKPHLDIDAETAVSPVGDFTARELVFTGARLSLTTRQEAACAAVLWYDASGDPTTPVVAEFSFRHREKKPHDPRFNAAEAGAAYLAFRTALTLGAWVDPTQQTKTAYVYRIPTGDGAGPGCMREIGAR